MLSWSVRCPLVRGHHGGSTRLICCRDDGFLPLILIFTWEKWELVLDAATLPKLPLAMPLLHLVTIWNVQSHCHCPMDVTSLQMWSVQAFFMLNGTLFLNRKASLPQCLVWMSSSYYKPLNQSRPPLHKKGPPFIQWNLFYRCTSESSITQFWIHPPSYIGLPSWKPRRTLFNFLWHWYETTLFQVFTWS